MKLLSIAIPTLNRSQYLSFTLDSFIHQIEEYQDDVEIIICNNASDDNTSKIISEFVKGRDYVVFKDCDNRVALGDSFKRTVSYSSGQYLILWGDDDIPAPYLISYLLHLIKTQNNIGLFYFNRLVGYENGNPIKSLTLYNNNYIDVRKIYEDSSEFITEHFWGATFMSSIMFTRDVWERGLKFDTTSHYGFEFMGILYYGNRGKAIDYEYFPLCIQRKVANRAWATDWPIYALLGLPNMSKDLEAEGIFKDGLNVWNKQYNRFPLFCYILMSAATDRKKYKPYCKSFASYQKTKLRKILIYSIIYCMPAFVYKLSRKLLFKLKK